MAPSGIPGDLPEVIQPYQARGFCLVDLIVPLTRGTKMDNTEKYFEYKEGSAVWDSGKGSGTEALQMGADGQNPVELRASETPLIGNTFSVTI